KAARASAFDRQPVTGSPFFLDQVICGIYEIEEGIFLLHEHTVETPLPAHLVAASNVRDCISHSAVEQAEPRTGKCHRSTEAIGPVGVEEQRRLAVPRKALFVHDRYGNLCAIARRSPQALAEVLRRVISA